jgi:ribosomal protein S18 acetylase RimI-like enzyme
MLPITNRPYYAQRDQDRLFELLLAYRVATSVQTYPTIWRTRLLLTSRVWDSAHDSRVWEGVGGQMLGLAMLWRRRREDNYLVLDRFVQPDRATDELADAMLAWGVQRAHGIAREQAAPMTLYARTLNLPQLSNKHLEAHGFIPVARDPEQYNVYFARSLEKDISVPVLPDGYGIRPLNPQDAAAYQALYDFAAVNPEHFQELLASEEYEHLVVVNPEGTFVAYSEYSICRAEWERSGQKIGWVDYVGTIPEQRQKGLSKAVVLTSLRRLQSWGAETVQLVTINTNTPAVRLYDATGFLPIPVSEPARYAKRINMTAAA